MVMLKIAGIYNSDGTIILAKGRYLHWEDLSGDISPELPPSYRVELILSFSENELLSGVGGFVWATRDPRQAEIVQSTLNAQHISSEIKNTQLQDQKLFMLRIANPNDINDAIDFIWKGQSGLRLKPDWIYPEGEKNRSFEEWLSGQ
jgi:hypothetical protein